MVRISVQNGQASAGISLWCQARLERHSPRTFRRGKGTGERWEPFTMRWDRGLPMTMVVYIYMIIYDYIWLYMNIYIYIWLYMIIFDYIWLYMIVYAIYIYMWYVSIWYLSAPPSIQWCLSWMSSRFPNGIWCHSSAIHPVIIPRIVITIIQYTTNNFITTPYSSVLSIWIKQKFTD